MQTRGAQASSGRSVNRAATATPDSLHGHEPQHRAEAEAVSPQSEPESQGDQAAANEAAQQQVRHAVPAGDTAPVAALCKSEVTEAHEQREADRRELQQTRWFVEELAHGLSAAGGTEAGPKRTMTELRKRPPSPRVTT